MPSGPNLRQPPLWPPLGHSKMIFSDAKSATGGSPFTVKRDTREPFGWPSVSGFGIQVT
jgi:hypothetical protein